MVRLPKFRIVAVFTIASALSLYLSTAFGDEGGLSLPTKITEPVVLSLDDLDIDLHAARPSEVLRVFAGGVDACCAGRAPMAGRYEKDGGRLVFTPAFGFVHDQQYTVSIRASDGDKGWRQEKIAFRVHMDSPIEKASVVGVYPSGDILPENVLRFYIHFTKPMKPHIAFDYVKLIDSSGVADDAAFMKFKQELWNEDRTRLTVLMDPGRIKREVATNVRLGPALVAGGEYELIVEGGWPAADGASALKKFSKRFTVSDGLRELPNTNLWTITPPRVGSRDDITISFDRPFDKALLHKHIQVFALSGERIFGETRLADNERSWLFKPQRPWGADEILLIVSGELEDVAGNNFRDLLDHSVDVETRDIPTISIPVALKR